jgi:hypothetical protein
LPTTRRRRDPARGLAGSPRFRLGLRQFAADFADQTRIARQAEQEVDAVDLAPTHQLLAAEAGVAAKQNAHARPTRPDLRDDPRDLLLRARTAVDVGAPELGRQQMSAAEHIKWQITVAIVVGVEKPALLIAVQGVVGGVEVEGYLLGRFFVRLEKEVDEQALDRGRLVRDLTILRRRVARQFEPVQRGFAGHRRAVRTPRCELAGQNRHQRIMAQVVVVVEILISQRKAEYALPDQGGHRVFDISAITRVAKAAGQATNQTDRLVRRSQKKPTGIRRHRPAVEFGHHGPALDRWKLARFRATLRLHRGTSLRQRKSLSQNNLSLIRSPDAPSTLRNPG